MGDGGPATNARLTQPRLLAMDAAGNLYVGESAARVRKISLDGTITTVAGNAQLRLSGDGGPATAAQIGLLGGLAVDLVGNLYISDNYFIDDGSGDDSVFVFARVRMISSDGMIHTIAGSTPGYSGDGGVATRWQLIGPGTLATDIAGNLYIVDGGFNYFNRSAARIRKISLDGNHLDDRRERRHWLLRRWRSGNQRATRDYFRCGDGQSRKTSTLADATRIRKISQAGSSQQSRATAIPKRPPSAMAVPRMPLHLAGLLAWLSTAPASCTSRIRSTIASERLLVTASSPMRLSDPPAVMAMECKLPKVPCFWPSGLAIDSRGNLYIADSGNGRIRVIYPDWRLINIGCGTRWTPAIRVMAGLTRPVELAQGHRTRTPRRSTYIADTGNNRIRMVTSAGEITTIAEPAPQGTTAQAMAATEAQPSEPT